MEQPELTSTNIDIDRSRAVGNRNVTTRNAELAGNTCEHGISTLKEQKKDGFTSVKMEDQVFNEYFQAIAKVQDWEHGEIPGLMEMFSEMSTKLVPGID
jgi:hypothetical protein